jgi:hypothetical protein
LAFSTIFNFVLVVVLVVVVVVVVVVAVAVNRMFRWFMISYLSEEEVLKKYKFWWNVHQMTGVGLVVIGIYCIGKAFNEI